MKKMFVLINLCLLLLNCKDDKPEPKVNTDVPNTNQDFELVWQTTTPSALVCTANFVYSDGVVYFVQDNQSQARDHIISLDKLTGDTLWVWSEGPMYTGNHHMVDNTLYFNGGRSIYSVDPTTGTTNWEFEPPGNLAYLNLHVNTYGIFVSYQDRKINGMDNETILFQLDRFGGSKEILRIPAKDRDGFTCNFEYVTPWVHPKGDLHLICESRSWHYGDLNQGKGEYFVYNLTADSMYWDLKSFFNELDLGASGVLDGDVFYCYSGWDQVGCIDLLQKRTLWSVQLPERNRTGSKQGLEVFQNNVFLSPGKNGVMTALDKSSGQIVHTITDLGDEYFGQGLIEFDGLLWLTTNTALYGIDGDGKIKYKLLENDLLEGRGGSYTNGLSIDKRLGQLHTTRGSDFVCLKPVK